MKKNRTVLTITGTVLAVVFVVCLVNLKKIKSEVWKFFAYMPPLKQIKCVALAPSPIKRFEGPAVVVDNKVYFFGGFYTPTLQATNRVDVYHPVNKLCYRQLLLVPQIS